jgi:hypothetical protein
MGVQASTFVGNRASKSGGVAYLGKSNVTVSVSGSTFTGNSVGASNSTGGVLYFGGSTSTGSPHGSVAVSSSAFVRNSAVYGGVGYFSTGSFAVSLTSSSFLDGVAGAGGVLVFDGWFGERGVAGALEFHRQHGDGVIRRSGDVCGRLHEHVHDGIYVQEQQRDCVRRRV